MNRFFTIIAALLVVLAGCNNTNNKTTSDMNNDKSLQEVAGRKNFGPNHARECKVVSFEDGMLIGEVINQSADESILTDGKVNLAKLKPIVFDAAGMCYRALGEVVGQAWGAGKEFTD